MVRYSTLLIVILASVCIYYTLKKWKTVPMKQYYHQKEQINVREEINADIILGNKDKSKIVEYVEDYIKNKEQKKVFYNIEDVPFEDMELDSMNNRTRAFVKIEDGCENYCTYCIIPYARGRLRSKSLQDITTEVESLVSNGHKEIVLVGINLMFYGVEFGTRLVDAVETCAKISGVERIRLGSLEPEVITDDDLIRLSKIEKFCPQFHLSLQSGCDKTLKDMNRAYTSSEYYELVSKIRKIFPNSAITTDVMVGFPNETLEDFNTSLKFVEKVGFAKVHIFPYSRRSGTPADKMKNQLTKTEKQERVKQMSIVAQKTQAEFLKSQVGKVFPVLFERENEDNFHHGYTPNYTLVKIPRENIEKSLRKSIFYVKIEVCKDDYCIGSIVE